MPPKKIVYYSVLLMLLTSCKAFKSLTSSSYNATNENRPKTSDSTKGKKIHFLNDIEVSPGNTVRSQHVITKDKYQQHSATEISRINPSVKTADLEKANKFQLKYAVLMDVNIEELTNIALLQKIDEWWGTRYCYGGNTRSCIDCSAFTQVLLHDVYNINVPRTAQEQYAACNKINESDLHEGDLVFFHGTAGRRAPYISHVGMYLDNNKFVHASSSSGVIINDLDDSYFRKHFVCGGRVRPN